LAAPSRSRFMPAAGGGASAILFACVQQRFLARPALRVALRPHTLCAACLCLVAAELRVFTFARSQVLL